MSNPIDANKFYVNQLCVETFPCVHDVSFNNVTYYLQGWEICDILIERKKKGKQSYFSDNDEIIDVDEFCKWHGGKLDDDDIFK